MPSGIVRSGFSCFIPAAGLMNNSILKLVASRPFPVYRPTACFVGIAFLVIKTEGIVRLTIAKSLIVPMIYPERWIQPLQRKPAHQPHYAQSFLRDPLKHICADINRLFRNFNNPSCS